MKNGRVGDLEGETLSKLRNEAIKAKAQNEPKVARCWKQASGPNCTFKPLVLKISHGIFILLALLCVNFAWRSAVGIPVADRCVRVCGRTSISREQNKKPRSQVGLSATELLNVQLTCFSMSYGTISFCFQSGLCRIANSEKHEIRPVWIFDNMRNEILWSQENR